MAHYDGPMPELSCPPSLHHTFHHAADPALRENRLKHEELEELVRNRTRELEETRRQVMQRLSRAAEYKDNETGRHVIRVGRISRLLGRLMQWRDQRRARTAATPDEPAASSGLPTRTQFDGT